MSAGLLEPGVSVTGEGGRTVKKILTLVALAGLVSSLAFITGAGALPPQFSSQNFPPYDCPDADGTIDVDGATKLWPPNHKMKPYDIHAIPDDESDHVDLVTFITHDEYADPETHSDEMNGSGNPNVTDAEPFQADSMGDGTQTTHHDIRAERSGRGTGRLYDIRVTATFDGDACSDGGPVSFYVCIPHDMGKGIDCA
jgi:hypothetical protein